MRVLVTTESRFDRTPDGACWTIGSAGYTFWQRYLDVFDEVGVVARVCDAPNAPPSGVRADGRNVSLAALPPYIGPWAFMRSYHSLRRAARGVIHPADAVIIRAPGVASSMLLAALRSTSE